jgi:hypothetical protein
LTNRGQILYAADILSADDATGRLPRRLQSAAATRLLEGLGGPGFLAKVCSKSHSRAAIAAAASDMPGLSLGVDIEWMAPHRQFAAIARSYLGVACQEMDATGFYRGWTFFEAYYKALQHFPDAALVASAIAQDSDGTAHGLDDGTWYLHRRVAQSFQLCLVWRLADLNNCIPIFALQAGRAIT